MTRNGKIARLPRTVREQLNQRLGDGEQGKALVAWLNGLPEVQAMLVEQFQGRAVTEQNLSEWKQGGHQDWLRHQEALECVRTAAEQAQELAEVAGPVPLTDVLSASVALLLTKLIREVESGRESTPEARRELLALIREWSAVRKGDHKAARLKMNQEDWTTARAKVAAAEKQAVAEAVEKAAQEKGTARERKLAEFQKQYDAVEHQVVREIFKIQSHNQLVNTLVAGARPEKAQWMREFIETEIKERRDKLVEKQRQEWEMTFPDEDEDGEEDEDAYPEISPPESGPILLDPT